MNELVSYRWVGAFLLALALCAGCTARTKTEGAPAKTGAKASTIRDPQKAAAAPQVTSRPVRYTDVTSAAGLKDWRYQNGATGRHFFVESTGGGVALVDFNRDGWLDVFALQGGPIPGAVQAAERAFSTRSALFLNQKDGTFRDVTEGSGLDGNLGYGQGVSATDFDNDGWCDLYVTAYGGNRLLRNNGDGTFTDVTKRAGVADADGPEPPWPLSSGWGDIDNDGYLDLFVCHYVRWSPAINRDCPGSDGRLLYCRPQVYEPNRCRFYRNNGDGTFSDITDASGVGALRGKAMGVVWLDHDDDGWQDLFVTNDTMANFLLVNNRNGTFTDRAILAGVAFGEQGQASSGMGVAAGDYDADGWEDLFVVNFSGEAKSVFRNTGRGVFEASSYPSNVASMNLQFLGFGLEALDYDLDGHTDLVVGNGHVLDRMDSSTAGSSYEQSQQLLRNQGDGTFADDQRSLGDLVNPRVTRGTAVGDTDNDGDPDVVMVDQRGPLQLFRNDGGNDGSAWIRVRLEGTADAKGRSNRDALGAKVTVRTRDGKSKTQWVRSGSSYLSHSDTRLIFGLGAQDERVVSTIEVRWPSGRKQAFKGPVAVNRFYYLKETRALVPDPQVPVR